MNLATTRFASFGKRTTVGKASLLCTEQFEAIKIEKLTVGEMMKTKPIVPWMGGKRRLMSQLTEKTPKHECYVELFAGGAALFFYARTSFKSGSDQRFKWALVSRQIFEWLKDANIDLMTDIQ